MQQSEVPCGQVLHELLPALVSDLEGLTIEHGQLLLERQGQLVALSHHTQLDPHLTVGLGRQLVGKSV